MNKQFICKDEKWTKAETIQYVDEGFSGQIIYSSSSNSNIYDVNCDDSIPSWDKGEDGDYRICQDYYFVYDESLENWEQTKYKGYGSNTLEELGGCTTKKDGELAKTSNFKWYVCNGIERYWRSASSIEIDDGITCSQKNYGEFYESNEWDSYWCGHDGWIYTRAMNWELPKEVFLNFDLKYDSIIDSRDNQVYKTITIDTQTWIAENLNYEYNKGTVKSFCFEEKQKNCDVAGRLYPWAAASDTAICPTGWHVPSAEEFNTLLIFLRKNGNENDLIKSINGWDKSAGGDNKYGFSAIAAGYLDDKYGYREDGYTTYFWTTTNEEKNPSALRVNYGTDEIMSESPNQAFSIRCLKNE